MVTQQQFSTRASKSRRLRALLLALCVVSATAFSTPAGADRRHNPEGGAHPLRIIAYVLHPVGYLIDTVLVRPAHWVVSRPSLAPIFGHTNS